MGKTYNIVTHRLSRWLYQYIDRYAYGLKPPDQIKPFRRYKDTRLDVAKQSGYGLRHLEKLTMTHVEKHLFGDTRYYYISKPSSHCHLLMVDIDAHDGEQDAWNAAQWLTEMFFPGAYWEPSTNWAGAHLYLLCEAGYWKRSKFNEIVSGAGNSLAKYLRAVVADEGFEARVCGVYGTCPVRNKEGRTIKAGSLAKVPRPRTVEDMDRLRWMPCFNWLAWRSVIDEARSRGIRLEDGIGGVEVAECHARQQSEGADDNYPCNILSTRFHQNTTTDMLQSHCAWQRSKGTVMVLAQELGRLPGVNEVAAVYEQLDLGSGEADRDRIRRHARAINIVAQTYDPGKAQKQRYQVGQYLPVVTKLLTYEDLWRATTDAKYPRRLTHDDLDIGLGYHVVRSLGVQDRSEQEFTAPVDGMIKWFRKLKDKGLISRSCNYGKVRAIRLGLLRAGLILVLDVNYTPAALADNNVGIAKKWGLGENCPEYGEYAEKHEQYKLARRPILAT